MAFIRRILDWFLHLFKREMKRRISLYIADRLVELDEQSLILFNYTMEDLTNPTYVKNSYSKQITIKGTPNNNKIFGEFFRLDRKVEFGGASGATFNPMARTPFTIFNELGEILESGYAKLDNVKKVGADVEYKVSLYGGLGSFLYNLAYDTNGNKKNLASLNYFGYSNDETEMDFVINKTAIEQAWADRHIALWDTINFAPAYNGIPDGNFSPNKALVNPNAIGIPAFSPGHIYETKYGYARINFSKSYDEWAVKDLRSYLQRPVLRINSLLKAIANPINNGGYNVDLSGLDDMDIAYKNLWMTLPLIPSLGTYKKMTGDLSIEQGVSGAFPFIGRYNIVSSGEIPSGTITNTNLNVRISADVPTATDETIYMRSPFRSGGAYWHTLYFVQVTAYGNDGAELGYSKVKCVSSAEGDQIRADQVKITPMELAEIVGYVQDGGAEFETSFTDSTITKSQGGKYLFNANLGFSIEATGVAYYQVKVTIKEAWHYTDYGSNRWVMGSDANPYGRLYQAGKSSSEETYVYPTGYTSVDGTSAMSVSYTTGETLRSGAVITKKMLLTTEHSPADYLISFCRVFGLHMLYDNTTKTISIVGRNSLYDDETIDLTERVDKAKGIELNPFLFDSKWYDFKLESVGGRFADEYKATQGFDYGIQRVNTGYEFNAESKNIMDGVVFKNGVTILDRSPYYTSIEEEGDFKPSVFVDSGHTETLWNNAMEEWKTDINVPSENANVRYLNEYGHEGYDVEFARKMEFRNKDNKPISGENVLVYLEGFSWYPYFQITDDVPAMEALNEGTPCWLITPGSEDGIRIPIFQRYGRYTAGGFTISNWSLDFGVPMELDIPAIRYDDRATIYHKYWRSYMRDRYDKDTKVMKCRVDFKGIPVSQDLLRKFYFYGGSIWVLNKITNYSLTTYDAVECEFIQVQDKENYLNGQI